MSNHAQYLSPFFTEEREKLKEMFEEFFSTWDTRTALVGTGTSGILALGMIASIRTDIPIIIVRKAEFTHSYREVEAPSENLFSKWAFVDDLLSTGDTFNRVKSKMVARFSMVEFWGGILYNGTYCPEYFPNGWVRQSQNIYKLVKY